MRLSVDKTAGTAEDESPDCSARANSSNAASKNKINGQCTRTSKERVLRRPSNILPSRIIEFCKWPDFRQKFSALAAQIAFLPARTRRVPSDLFDLPARFGFEPA